MNRAAEKKNEELMMEFQDSMTERQREAVTELLDDTALTARKEGVYIGMRYMLRGLLALLEG